METAQRIILPADVEYDHDQHTTSSDSKKKNLLLFVV